MTTAILNIKTGRGHCICLWEKSSVLIFVLQS